MKKELSHQEKLELFEKFYEPKFNKKYRTSGKNYLEFGFLTLTILSASAIFLALVNTWFLLLFFPALATPITASYLDNKKKKELIESLDLLPYKDFLNLQNSTEWKELSDEYCDKVMRELYHERLKKSSQETKKSNKIGCDIEITEEETKDYMI